MMMNLDKLNNEIRFLKKNVLTNIEDIGMTKSKNFNTVFLILEDRLTKIQMILIRTKKSKEKLKKI